MASVDELLIKGLKNLPERPPETAGSTVKKNYSEKVSNVAAAAFAAELRDRGFKGARPSPPGDSGKSGAERRMAGGIGAKKVDVTWATEEAGLVFAISIKSINWRDKKSGNFQKNLTNRRGDMLFEGVTLHRRFPYAVLSGFFFLDEDAAKDKTAKRKSTFENAHTRLRLFTGRSDPAGRDEQFERLYLVLLNANKFSPSYRVFLVGDQSTEVSLNSIFDELTRLVVERNSDFYEYADGKIKSV